MSNRRRIAALLSAAFCSTLAFNATAAAPLELTAKNTEIVLAEGTAKSVRFAAEELQTFLGRTLGAEVPVVATPSADKYAIVLGTNALTVAAGIFPERLPRDSFVLRREGRRIYIAGCDDPKFDIRRWVDQQDSGVWVILTEKATLFGVYEFLERYAGTRFYFAGELGTIVRPRPSLAVPATLNETVTPAFWSRRYGVFGDNGPYVEGDDRAHPRCRGKKLDLLRHRLETQYFPSCHGSNGFRLLHRFAATHPEYFTMTRDGQRLVSTEIQHPGSLCWSSKVIDEMTADILSYARGESADVRGMGSWRKRDDVPADWAIVTFRRPWVDVMPQDGMRVCNCAACQDYFAAHSNGVSSLVWRRTAEIARNVRAAGSDLRITQMAYGAAKAVPDVDLPDNVDVCVALAGPWQCASPKRHQLEMDLLKSWYAKLGNRKVSLWTYVNKYGEMKIPDIPNGAPRCVGRFFRNAAPWIIGGYIESENDRWLYNQLTYYVFSRVMWNPDADVEAILDEYFRLMFGPAAEPMAKLTAEIEKRWVKDVAGSVFETPLGPQRQPPSRHALYTEIYTPSLIARWKGYFRRAFAAVPSGSDYAKRLTLMKEEILDPFVAAAEAYTDSVSVEKELARRAADAGRTPNLIVNGDFKYGAGRDPRFYGAYDGYRFLGGFYVAKGNERFVTFEDGAPGGARAAVIGSETNQTVRLGQQWPAGTFKPNHTYRVSLFVKLENVGRGEKGGGIGVNFWLGKNYWFPLNRLVGTTDWIHQEYVFTTDATATPTAANAINLDFWHATGKVSWSGVRVEDITEEVVRNPVRRPVK